MPLRISVGGIVDSTDLLILRGKLLSGKCALVGIAEADAESGVAGLDNRSCGSGGSHEEDAVLGSCGAESLAGCGGNGAEGDLHAALKQGGEALTCLNGAGLVVLHVELEVYSVETACGVNLVNG